MGDGGRSTGAPSRASLARQRLRVQVEIDTWRQTGPLARTAGFRRRAPDVLRRIDEIDRSAAVHQPEHRSENAYFADGLTEEVIANLSKVRPLRVISRTSSMVFKDTKNDVKTIARRAWRSILPPGKRASGEQLRISAHSAMPTATTTSGPRATTARIEMLCATGSSRTSVRRGPRDPTSPMRTAAARERPIRDVHAYECYLRARHEAWRWRRDAIDHAIQLLHNGLAIVGDKPDLRALARLSPVSGSRLDFSEPARRCRQGCVRRIYLVAVWPTRISPAVGSSTRAA